MLHSLRRLSGRVYLVFILFLLIAPLLSAHFQQSFYLDLLTRILILAIAAASLNLIIGFGGMISFGHAAFLGIGAYSVGIPAYYDMYNGYVHLGLAIVCSALFALITGAISLRTRGLYFIMITLAFAQMLYFTFVSLDEYGADDGLVQDIGRQAAVIPEQRHKYTQVDRVLEQIIVFLPDSSQAAESIGIPEHGMLELIRQLVDGRYINGATHFGVAHKVANQVLGLAVDLLGDDDFFGKRNMGPQPWGQFTRLLKGRLVPAIHFGGRL